MDQNRRNLLLSTLFGGGMLGLRALATGLPLGLLAAPRIARAAPPEECAGVDPQFLILMTSNSGDPLNANVPGCYGPGLDELYHPPGASMAESNVVLGGKTYRGAKPWADLSAPLRDRACFFHHGTYTNAHGDAPKVNKLMGGVRRQEMMVSLFSQTLAPCMETVQTQPVVISQNLISSAGQVLPVLNPVALRSVLTGPKSPLDKLRQQRDTDLDRLNALFKESGRSADRAMLDKYALSQQQVRSIREDLLSDLAGVTGSTRNDLNIAASVLCKMKVSPVVVMRYSWGGDNHNDTDLAGEARETVASAQALNELYDRLVTYGLQDQVTFAMQNVFGRTLHQASHSGDRHGRNHNASHHASVFIGKGFKGSVVGGVKLNTKGNDFIARGIDSATGSANDGGDIAYDATLASAGTTLGRALGVPLAVLEENIPTGKPVAAALR